MPRAHRVFLCVRGGRGEGGVRHPHLPPPRNPELLNAALASSKKPSVSGARFFPPYHSSIDYGVRDLSTGDLAGFVKMAE
jgi:hypothetical protein